MAGTSNIGVVAPRGARTKGTYGLLGYRPDVYRRRGIEVACAAFRQTIVEIGS